MARMIICERAAGRVTTVTNPESQVTTYAYDGNGRRTLMTDARPVTVTYAYDDDGRLTGETFPGAVTFSHAYDANGNQTQMTSSAGTSTYAYDDANRLTAETDATGKATTYAYDNDSRMTSKAVSGVGTFAYAYDNVARQTKITDPQSKVTSFAFDANGRQTLTQLPNGVSTTTGYRNGRIPPVAISTIFRGGGCRDVRYGKSSEGHGLPDPGGIRFRPASFTGGTWLWQHNSRGGLRRISMGARTMRRTLWLLRKLLGIPIPRVSRKQALQLAQAEAARRAARTGTIVVREGLRRWTVWVDWNCKGSPIAEIDNQTGEVAKWTVLPR